MLPNMPFPKWLLNCDIEVFQTLLNENGEEDEKSIYQGKCNFTEESRQIMNSERQLIMLNGSIVIEGDIAPGSIIEGYVIVKQMKRRIARICRPTNPNGSVFSTEIDLE